MRKIYLDDVRTPTETGWVVVRNFAEFRQRVEEIGLINIEIISLDHMIAVLNQWQNISTMLHRITL
jgi:hypothetical protein